MQFYDELDRLLNPAHDMGGAAGPRDAGAIAKLIMGGGSASLDGQQLFGQPMSTGGDLGPGVLNQAGGEQIQMQPAQPSKPTKKPLSSNLQAVLDSADQIATSLGSVHGKGRGGPSELEQRTYEGVLSNKPYQDALEASETDPYRRQIDKELKPQREQYFKDIREVLNKSTLLPNPYGPGSYDPQNPEQVAEVQAQGKKVAEADRGRQMLDSLSANPVFTKLPQAGQSEIVKGLLERMGVSQSDEQKAYATARGTARGKASVSGTGKLDELLSVQDATKLGVPYGTTKREAASKGLTGMTPAQQNTINEMGRARVVVGHLIEVANRIKDKYASKPGALNRMGAYVKNNLAAVAQDDEDLAEYTRLKNALLAVVSRTVGGERGQSTEKDVNRAEGATPDFLGAISKGKLPDTGKVVDAMGPALLGLLDELEDSAYKGINRHTPQGTAPAGAAPAGKVIMIDSKGRKGYVPESQVNEALKSGYKKG